MVDSAFSSLRSAIGGLLALLALLCASVTAQDDFTVVVLPDTQYYAATYPDIFLAQAQWIAANRDAMSIRFVIHEGDIVDSAEDAAQWAVAEKSVHVLENAGVAFAWAIGNHDYDNEAPSA